MSDPTTRPSDQSSVGPAGWGLFRSCALKGVLILCFVVTVKETLWQETEKAVVPTQPTAQYVRYSTLGKNISFRPPKRNTRITTLKDMPDLVNVTGVFHNNTFQNLTWDEALVGRERVVEILHRAGVKFDLDVLKILPLWSQVKHLYGGEPVILGLDQCAAFQESHPREERFVGIAGQHNCGTNAMAKYMMQNLVIPDNPSPTGGILANVPWHKHGWVDMRTKYMFSPPKEHEKVLPIIIVRDPYYWLHSMCESPYLMKWPHTKSHCPNLVMDPINDVGVGTWTKWGKYERSWDSLAHVWSEFNGEYFRADFPRLVIRFEDLLFHTPEVLGKIRECVDARWKKRYFMFSPSAVKTNKYFTDIKPQTSMLSAIIKYGQDQGRRTERMSKNDLAFARKHLDAELMAALGYSHPEF